MFTGFTFYITCGFRANKPWRKARITEEEEENGKSIAQVMLLVNKIDFEVSFYMTTQGMA